MSGNRTPLLDVESLSVALPGADGSPRAILRDVGFAIERGERLGIVGESGSGKSLLASTLIGLLPAGARVAGSIRLGGSELVGLPDRRMDAVRGKRIAMVFQEPATALNPAMRVGRQVAEAVRLDGIAREPARRRALELIDRVRIPEAARRFDAFPHELSGGQRQRIGIAIALARDPDLLVADEPTTALDVTVQAEILDLLHELSRERDMALLLISHDVAVIERATDRVIVLYAGTRFESGPTAEILGDPANPYTEALLSAVPRRTPGGRLPVIGGAVPRFDAPPPGCRFAPRCSLHLPACDDGEPEWRHLSDGRGVRCIRAGETRP